MHEMNLAQTQVVKDCVYEAIRNSQARQKGTNGDAIEEKDTGIHKKIGSLMEAIKKDRITWARF